MARQVAYTYKGQAKVINFAYDKYHDMYEAAAAAEGVDLTRFLAMEQQVAMTAKGKGALKSYRLNEFARMGFKDIRMLRDDEQV
ncbi:MULTISPECIES: DUF2960 domain-containing protein [Shewanella]|uniref:DUF2960 domain-containing protein n=2 Tax=Shewanella TaxID=22 RepID=A1S3Q0_SHEAM|nr:MULTISPECIES: DUF2960 domain-containing protein [Shewanella]ABL99006.1 conserved hypothetical protein [Shewanella amazonensis SB2B]MCL2917416.1 DUF2960 domain-containing protein [Shewanella litorisediminis]QRH02549.1 DUF2960 domain-containing protein [Shewanella litorisediminis]QYK06085.1 DUF2960 domain-containing protein [Shewanella zhangzhouensis]